MGPWPPLGSGTPFPEEKEGLKGVGLERGRVLPAPMSSRWAPPCWPWEERCLSLGHNRVPRALPIILFPFSIFVPNLVLRWGWNLEEKINSKSLRGWKALE